MSVVVQRHVRKRGFFGKLFKLLFVLFNVLMVLWLGSYWLSAGNTLNTAASDAEKVGGAIGVTIGTGILVFFWAAGAIILGLFTLLTRGQTVVITEEKK